MVEEYMVGDKIESLVFWDTRQFEDAVVLYITSDEHMRYTLLELMPWIALKFSSEEYWGEVKK